MNRKILLPVAMFLLAASLLNSSAQGTSFFYQGRLSDNGTAASGVYELRFALFDAVINGNAISVPQTNFGVVVTNGLFETNLNFGAVFTGTNYWLSIGVRTNGNTNGFTLLAPRQPLLPVPYAIFANTASNVLGSVSATQLVGTLPSAQVSGNYFGSVNFTNATNSFFGKYFGNGVGLTNLNGSMIATGTVADARLSTNVALLNTNQIFSGVNVFNNATNSFTGNFFGNGLVGWIPIPSNSVQAVRDTGYLLLSSNLTTVTLPPTASLLVGDIVRISGAGSGGWRLAQNAGQVISGLFLNASNSVWLPSNAGIIGWQSLASSADGLKLVGAATSTGGGIFSSTDAGKTWSTSILSYSPLSMTSSSDGSVLVGVVNGGGIVMSTNTGATWQLTTAPNPLAWTCVASSTDGNRLAATINVGNIYTSIGGSNWTLRASPLGWNSIASSADGSKLAAVVLGGKIWTSADYGVNWTQQGNAPTTNWVSITSSADGSRLAAAVNAVGGHIYTSADFGVNWTLQGGSPTNYWYNIASSSDGGRLFACASPGGVYVSVNGGVSWTRQVIPTQNWHAVACADDGTKAAAACYLAASGNGIFYQQLASQFTSSTVGVNGSVSGGPGTAVELQYIGNDVSGNAAFLPIGGTGTIWGN